VRDRRGLRFGGAADRVESELFVVVVVLHHADFGVIATTISEG
jgi:hypothetical protein